MNEFDHILLWICVSSLVEAMDNVGVNTTIDSDRNPSEFNWKNFPTALRVFYPQI